MEETLRLFYSLQKIDSNLDDVERMKGDLPAIVAQLQNKVESLQTSINERQNFINASVAARNKADNDIVDFKQKLERYKTQQYQVRNNKEYDAITKEIDFATESIKNLETQFTTFETKMTGAKNEVAELTKQLEEATAELEEKKTELVEVSKETEDEELQYQHEREKIIARLKADQLARYELIRKGRGGVAVASLRRNSCSGCNNRIPPQHIFEIRKSKSFYLCQHCGRIIVSEELAHSVQKAQ